MNKRGEMFGIPFSKKVPFLANIKPYPEFLEYALTRYISRFKVTPDIDFMSEAVFQCYIPVAKILLQELVIYK